jgi:hypothetical protein
MQDGRRWLSILERSNLGDIRAIEIVLDHTYARRGRRKHEILDVNLSHGITVMSIGSNTRQKPKSTTLALRDAQIRFGELIGGIRNYSMNAERRISAAEAASKCGKANFNSRAQIFPAARNHVSFTKTSQRTSVQAHVWSLRTSPSVFLL